MPGMVGLFLQGCLCMDTHEYPNYVDTENLSFWAA